MGNEVRAALLAIAAIGGVLYATNKPCDINEKALATIESQNRRLMEQNERLSEANRIIGEAISTLPDDQAKLVKLTADTEALKARLEKEIVSYQDAMKAVRDKPCLDEKKVSLDENKVSKDYSELSTGGIVRQMASPEKKTPFTSPF